MNSRNNGMDRYEPYATADEPEDLAPALTIKEAAEIAKRLLRDLPDDLIDGNLGNGF